MIKSPLTGIHFYLLTISATTIAMSVPLSGCLATSTYTTTGCALPSDQAGTLTARWAAYPIPLAVHQGDFAPSEIVAISNAAQTWNSFFGASAQIQIYDDNSASNFRTSTLSLPAAAGLCSSSDISGTQFSQPIVIYKDTTWPYTSETQAMALTTYCRNSASSGSTGVSAPFANPSSPLPPHTASSSGELSPNDAATTIQSQLPTFRVAMTEVNYEYFFTTSEVPDLETIILHELGHVLGLNHSCDNSGITGFPTCTGTDANTLYQEAVMYPVFGFDSSGNGQQRRSLNSNDEARANCLYEN